MRHTSLPLLLLLALVASAADVRAQAAPQVGSCTLGTAEAALDVNNVYAAVFNTGSLFFGNTLTNADGYLVPKQSGNSPIFASGLWVGGQVGGQIRVAGARYDRFNFWPGPLDAATHRPVNPASCKDYDRIYSVTRGDIAAYPNRRFSRDLTDWPVNLGAPYFVDLNKNKTRDDDEPSISRSPTDSGYGIGGTAINLANGELPDIVGDQGIWWVMNDVGNVHAGSSTPALGIEVQALAFAFGRADALGSTTFYKYKIINKSGAPIENTYVSIFSDPDLGDGADDYVGSDTAAGLGYVYNGTNLDASYGAAPPAVGYDFFQGPIVPDRGGDGVVDTLGTSAFSYFINGGVAATLDPTLGSAIYNFQQGLWADGSPMRSFGNGYGQTQGEITKFAFPGDPVANQAWSEVNNGSATPKNAVGDRRLVVHTGPFLFNDGDAQDIVFGVVYARGSSNLGSITALRAADRLAQLAYDINFALAPPPPAPDVCTDATRGTGTCLSASAENGRVSLTFGFPTTSPNYLGRFEVIDRFLAGTGATDSTYNFEGFNIYRYPTANFATDDRTLVATYDIVNGITEVRELVFDPSIGDLNTAITARGTDSGLRYEYSIDGLTNNTDYYFGVTSYSFNDESTPKVIESQATTITARPSLQPGGIRTQSAVGDSLAPVITQQFGEGSIVARVVDPTALTGDSYSVVFFSNPDGTLNYSIRNVTKNTFVLDGAANYAQTGMSLELLPNVIVVDGLSFSVTNPKPGVRGIFEVDAAGEEHNLLGELNTVRPPTYAVSAQGANATDIGDILVNGTNSILDRLDFNNFLTTSQPNTYEIRWVDPAQGQAVLNRSAPTATTPARYLTCWEIGRAATNVPATAGPFDLQIIQAPIVNGTPRMPFQYWQIAPDGTETQVHMNVLDADGDNCYSFDTAINTGSEPLAGFGYERFYGSKVPYVESELANVADVFRRANVNTAPFQAFGRMSIIMRTGPAIIPQAGTRVRIAGSIPNQVGDSFTFNTADAMRTEPTLPEQIAALDLIAAVPNPYYGQSGYETGNLSRIIRFTNLPSQVTTIRIYTVSGSLVQTLRKDGGSRSLDWNLQTVNNLPIASGMYLVHVDVEGVGERTLKLGVINRRSQVNVF